MVIILSLEVFLLIFVRVLNGLMDILAIQNLVIPGHFDYTVGCIVGFTFVEFCCSYYHSFEYSY